MTAKELSEQLGLREFLSLCTAVDKSQGTNTRFQVVKLTRDAGSGIIHCLVVYAGALIDRVDVPMFSTNTDTKPYAA